MELLNNTELLSGKKIESSNVEYFAKANSIEGTRKLKIGIWVYFILWIIEGALRKWVLPDLATPLLIVRDPVAIWLLYVAWKHDRFPFNGYILVVYIITLISTITAVIVGHGNILVALFGARIFLFHFPLVFLIGQVFTRVDVLKIGKALLWMAAPMALVIYLQFNSPQNSFINRGIGNNTDGAGFQGALGFFRPPGFFSFTTGNAQFFSFVSVFVLYFLLNQKEFKRYVIVIATIGLLIAIPLSISRTLFFQVSISVFFILISIIGRPEYFGKLIMAGVALIIIGLLLSKTDFIQTPIDALSTRFKNADDSEGGIWNTLKRGFADIDVPFKGDNFPFFGYGLGLGTNAGAQLLVGHSDEFLVAEGEWGRQIGELGIVMGFAIILMRLRIVFRMVALSYKKLSENDLLPWMLVSVAFISFAQSQWAQPATLGFSVLITGLTLAALKTDEEIQAGNKTETIENA